MIAVAAIVSVVAGLIGWLAMSALAARLRDVAPDVHARLGAPSARTLFWYGRLPHEPNAALGRFIWRREFSELNDRRARVLGWLALGGPVTTLISFVVLAVLQWRR